MYNMSDTTLNLFNSDTELDIINNIILTNKQLQLQDVENWTNILATKAPINNPNFTGIVSGITKTMVGLPNVDNTSDADKQISNQTQTALNNKPDKYLTYTGPRTYNTTYKQFKVDSYSKSESDSKYALASTVSGSGFISSIDLGGTMTTAFSSSNSPIKCSTLTASSSIYGPTLTSNPWATWTWTS